MRPLYLLQLEAEHISLTAGTVTLDHWSVVLSFVHAMVLQAAVAVKATMPVARILSILQQCVAGLHHLHSLGIIHRDFRAANILIAAKDPLHLVVADFGVSHQLGVYAAASTALSTAAGADTAVRTVLTGGEALSPKRWAAPEVLMRSPTDGVPASPASDVYMFGGLMFEVLTCGRTPYYWLSDTRLVVQRRNVPDGTSFRPEGLPTHTRMSGLGGLSICGAAAVDRIDVDWRVGGESTLDSELRRELIALMEHCLEVDGKKRPKLTEVEDRLQAMVARLPASS